MIKIIIVITAFAVRRFYYVNVPKINGLFVQIFLFLIIVVSRLRTKAIQTCKAFKTHHPFGIFLLCVSCLLRGPMKRWLNCVNTVTHLCTYVSRKVSNLFDIYTVRCFLLLHFDRQHHNAQRKKIRLFTPRTKFFASLESRILY